MEPSNTRPEKKFASTIDMLDKSIREFNLGPEEERKIVVRRPATGEYLAVSSVYIHRQQGDKVEYDDLGEPIPDGSIVIEA